MKDGIDFVVTWVDMDDPAWRASLAEWSGKGIDNSRNETSEARFRDYGFMKYWFRGVERFTPWVRYVHFVTCGQAPDWLDTSHPKLRMVNHADYIPVEFLPTFNSNVLEFYLHKIPDISERFVYFNDDFFLTRETPPERFFREGLPCDIAAFRFNSGGSQWAKMLRNNVELINKHFDKRQVMRHHREQWFTPEYAGKMLWNKILKFYPKFVTLVVPHNAQPFLRSTFGDVWDACGKELREASTHRFRRPTDLTPELFRTWQVCEGRFTPYNTYKDTKMFPLVLHSGAAIRALNEQKYNLVCLNDNVHIPRYRRVMEELKAGFEKILPEKSSFEL